MSSHFRIYGSYALEIILATAFGRAIDIQRGESDDLTKAVDFMFRSVVEGESLNQAAIILILSEFM